MTSIISNCLGSLANFIYSKNRVEVVTDGGVPAPPSKKTYPVLFNDHMWHQNTQMHMEPRANGPRLTISELRPSAMFDIASYGKLSELQRLRNEGIKVKGWFMRSNNVLSVYLGSKDPKWQKKLNFEICQFTNKAPIFKFHYQYMKYCGSAGFPPFDLRKLNKKRYLVGKTRSPRDGETSNILVHYLADKDKCIIDIITHLSKIFPVDPQVTRFGN